MLRYLSYTAVLVAMLFSYKRTFAQESEKQVLIFSQHQDRMTEGGTSQLKSVLEKAKTQKISKISITRYTDNGGNSIYNNMLARKRTNAVYNYFLGHGIDRDKVEIVPFKELLEKNNAKIDISKVEGYYHPDEIRAVEIVVDYKYAVPQAFKVKTGAYPVNASVASSVAIDTKGTLMHIPSNCFVDDFGNEVKGMVNIQFKEFKNAADIAFSGIPMNYKTYCFNSSGMFEITGATSNGKNVHIAQDKSIKIDYGIAKQNPDISFFKLNKDRTDWVKIQQIEPLSKGINASKESVVKQEQVKEPANMRGINKKVPDFQKMPINNNVDKWNDNWNNRRGAVNGINFDESNREQSTLLAEGINAGHTYPDVVKGLNVKGFGVYNCDQIYRLANKVQVNANFVDESGNAINDLMVLSLIDLNYNGAFSFDPKSFTCDAKGKNVLALFTQQGDLYILSHEDFTRMKISKSGTFTFRMKNMSSTIKSHQDLAKYLGIEV